MYSVSSLLAGVAAVVVVCSSIITTKADDAKNVLVISLEDVSGNDLLGFGTSDDSNDIFSSSKSSWFKLSQHYGGYQGSLSKMELLTGISSYHSGLGKLHSETFGHGMIGGIPQSQYILSEYLKESDAANYNTYYIGTWDLGYSMSSQLPNSRGFDYFYGSYTNENDIISKKSSLQDYITNTDPSMLQNDDNLYYDFWENENAVNEHMASKYDSNTQYTNKLMSIFDKENDKTASDSSSFYIHLSYQGAKKYIEKESNNEFSYDKGIETECSNYDNKRQSMCKYSLHLRKQLTNVVHKLKSHQNLWDNTLVVVLSHNGGSIAEGSCNYPLRGGKNTLLNGNLNTFAYVSGGAVSSNTADNELDGLFSTVDWLPTILSYVGILDDSVYKYSELDGVNQLSYLLGESEQGLRDHIMLHIAPWGHDNFGVIPNLHDTDSYERQWGWDGADTSVDNLYTETLNEILMVFYDENGDLWKYFVSDDVFDNENKYGTLPDAQNIEYNWCIDDYVSNIDFSHTYGELSGLFKLSNDVSESNNLLTTISYDDFSTLKEIVIEKADYYLNKEYNNFASQLFRSFDCFFVRKNLLAYPGAESATQGTWSPFVPSMDEYLDILSNECGLTSEHPVTSVHNSKDTGITFTDATDAFTAIHNQQRIATYYDNKDANNDNAITLEDLHQKQADIKSLSSLRTDKNSVTVNDNEFVYANCYGLEDGFYYIQIDLNTDNYPIVLAQCSNEYMLMNYNLDNNWEYYFKSWKQAHYMVASPIKSDAVDWEEWFLPDSGKTNANDYNYIVSPQCNECNEESLYQVNDLQTTYWENAVNSYCATNARGMPAGDAKWQSYTCRESVYSGVRGYDTNTYDDYVLYAMFVDDWLSTDYNGIDKEVLLTTLSGSNEGDLGTCLTMKQASNNEHFESVYECAVADQGNGNLPTLGTNGQYCVCAKKSSSSKNSKRYLTDDEKAALITAEAKKQEVVKEEDSKHKVHYLYQSDFVDGTYRIQEAGIYKIMEDIVFDYNAPDYDSNEDYSANSVYNDDGDIYWYPKVSQMSEYPGAHEWHDPYLLGFFAGITIESDDVTIDLNGHSLEMDLRYFYQQPWWSHIEIGSQAFVPGEGPSHFGATPTYVKNVEIKNGVLGLTSHHCIHGTAPEASLMTNVKISDLVCKDFITHGIQLNGFNGLSIDNVEIGPNAHLQYLTVDYSQMRTLLPRFNYYADVYESDTYRFGGKPSKDALKSLAEEYNYDIDELTAQVTLNNEDDFTLRDILDEMILQMDMAFDYVMSRKTEEELREEYGNKWLQSKRVFVGDLQNGIPYGGVIYGLYLNYPSSGISGFYRNSDSSYNVEVNNVYIHDITHSSREEAYLLKSMRSIFALPIIARFWMGDSAIQNFDYYEDDHSTVIPYYGTIVYDWLIAYYSILKEDIQNVEATNLLYFSDSVLQWANGQMVLKGADLSDHYKLTCNGDPMFHSVKGIFGLRLTSVKSAVMNNIKVENLRELSPIGTDVCGEYQKSHDIQQQLPYLYGFTGNNIHGVSVIDSDVMFSNLEVNNLNSLTGNATGMTLYPRSNVKFDNNNNKFSNILGGTSFFASDFSYDDVDELMNLPNQMPRACAIRKEIFEHSEFSIVVESLKENDGTAISYECINGYVGCDDEMYDGWSDYSTSNDNSYAVVDCNEQVYNNEIDYSMNLLSKQTDHKPLFKNDPKSTAAKLMGQVLATASDDTYSHSSAAKNSHASQTNKSMIIIMASIISVSALFLFVSIIRSLYNSNKINELNNKLNGYSKI